METESKPTIPWSGVSTDLTSFNSYGVVTLSNGKKVNVQMTLRHGMRAEKAYEDFKNYVAFLDMCATDHDVEFWDGTKKEGEGKSGIKQEVHVPVDSNGQEVENSFPAETLTVEYKDKKPYFKVTDAGVNGRKTTKFPVTVYPEVLERAGIVHSNVDPKEGESLLGWTAVYEKNEKGYPKKVVELLKPDFV
jgi:hypothetical protein